MFVLLCPSRWRLPGTIRWVLFGIGVVLVPLSGCGASGDAHVNLVGFQLKSHKNQLGNRFAYPHFQTSQQSDSSTNKLPLIIFLNGLGQNGDDGLPLKNNFGPQIWEMRNNFPCIAIAPQCSKDGSWSPDSADTQRVLAIIDETIKAHNIDPDRVYLTGVSSGGYGAWRIGSAYAERFAAIVPLCGGGGDSMALAEANLPIWNFCNDGDAKGLVNTNRSLDTSLIQMGLSPVYTEYHKSGHDCWNQAYRNKAMYEWLLQQSRSNNKLESEKFRLTDKEVSRQNEDLLSEGDEMVIESLSNTKSIVCGGFPPLIDYYCHAKFVPGQTLVLRLQSTNSDDQLVLHLPYAVDGLATFTKNSGNVFAYISPRAQNQLDAKGWNDIRLRVEKDRLSILINGFHALEQHLDLSGIKGWNIRLEPSGPEDSEMRFRYLCWRPLNWLMSSPN